MWNPIDWWQERKVRKAIERISKQVEQQVALHRMLQQAQGVDSDDPNIGLGVTMEGLFAMHIVALGKEIRMPIADARGLAESIV